MKPTSTFQRNRRAALLAALSLLPGCFVNRLILTSDARAIFHYGNAGEVRADGASAPRVQDCSRDEHKAPLIVAAAPLTK